MLLAITTTGKVVLIAVAATFILFALVTAMVIPRARPDFPGTRLRAYLALCLLLFAAEIAAVAWVTGTQEIAEAAGQETTPASTTPQSTTPQSTTPAAEPGDAAAGKQIFLTAGCKGCHTLKDAGATGSVGPNLDQAKPPYALVIDRVTHGKSPMPAFAGQLSEKQIQDVAKYVTSVAGK